MKFVTLLLFILTSISGLAQFEKENQEIITEATKLYKSERASWYGTDIFMAKFQDKREKARGYFSYVDVDNRKATCVFFSDEGKILASITFDSTYNVKTAVVDSVERDMNALEADLVIIRMAALSEYQKDRNFFKRYEKMNPNFIPLSDERGKRVYVLTGPEENDVVVFGNDYLLTFDDRNKLVDKRQLHATIIPFQSKGPDGKKALTTMHSHVSTTGDLITATDVCTLMLYCPFTEWKQHTVISQKAVSIWNCDKGLLILSREAWDRINKHQQEKKN